MSKMNQQQILIASQWTAGSTEEVIFDNQSWSWNQSMGWEERCRIGNGCWGSVALRSTWTNEKSGVTVHQRRVLWVSFSRIYLFVCLAPFYRAHCSSRSRGVCSFINTRISKFASQVWSPRQIHISVDIGLRESSKRKTLTKVDRIRAY